MLHDLRLSLDEAEAYVIAVLDLAGVSEGNAASVARALVRAEADGLIGHGLGRLSSYALQVKMGKVDGKAVPQVSSLAPALLGVDAGHGFAYPAIDLAIEALASLVAETGIALAGISRSSHCGAAGLHVERLAARGFVAMMFANSPAAIAPWGARKAVFGTNPIAFAAPLAGRPPAVVDLAVSKVAQGPLAMAAKRGESIPEGWALNAEGQPTTDPAAALRGTMLPMGDAKGTALAFMVEVLAAAVTGANFSFMASSFTGGAGGPPSTGQMLIVLDPARFGSGYGEHIAQLVEAIEGQEGGRLPGARRLAARAGAEREGVVLTAITQAELQDLGFLPSAR